MIETLYIAVACFGESNGYCAVTPRAYFLDENKCYEQVNKYAQSYFNDGASCLKVNLKKIEEELNEHN